MTMRQWIDATDPLNFTTVKLESYFRETKLGDATGFFFSDVVGKARQQWLITNWHVLAGRNAENPDLVLHSQRALPDRLKLSAFLAPDHPDYLKRPDEALWHDMFIPLYDENNEAHWLQHPQKNKMDVAAIPVGNQLRDYYIVSVNDVPQQLDMAIEIGAEVFLLGFPLGLTHFSRAPIWKRGSIASEPRFETSETGTRVLIDATTRNGMSGSPVIMRSRTHYTTDGRIKEKHNATRFIGIYASRPKPVRVNNVDDEDRRAELGYIYKAGCISQTVLEGIKGPTFGTIPL